MRNKLLKPHVLLPLLYGLAVVVYLAVCLVRFAGVSGKTINAEMPYRPLMLEDFALQSILRLDDENGRQRFVSTDPDPQMVYAAEQPFYAGRVSFSAAPHKPGGEIVLYYATNADFEQTGFDEANKLWAKQATNGSWYFDLDGRQVYALRLDPDTAGGVVWTMDGGIWLNQPKPAAAYFVPDAFEVFWLLAGPLFAAGVLVCCKQLLLKKKSSNSGGG